MAQNREVSVLLKAGQQGNGAGQQFREMGQATKNLAVEEMDYQKKLAGRIKHMEEQKRMQADLDRMGYGRRDPSFQERVDSEIKAIKEKKRLQEELDRLGFGQHKQTVGERADAQIKAQREQLAVRREMIKRGEIAPGMADIIGPGGMKAMAYGALAYAALKMVEGGLNSVAAGANALNNPLLTNAQRMEQFRESLPIIGGVMKAWRTFAESVDGTTAALIRNAERLRRAGVVIPAQELAIRQRAGLEAEQFSLTARAQALGRGAARAGRELSLPDPTSRTIQGQRAYELAERMLPHDRARIMAGAELAAAQQEARFAQQQYDDVKNRLAKVARGLGTARGDVNDRLAGENRGDRDKQGISNAATDWAERGLRAAQKSAGLAEAEARLKEAKNKAIQAGANLQQIENAAMREKASFLKQQIGIVQNQFQSYGAMLPGDQMFAMQAAKRFKKVGFQGLAPEERGILGQAGFGDVMSLEALKNAERDPRNQQLRALMGVGQADLKQMQRQLANVTVATELAVALDAAEVARKLAENIGPIISDAMMRIKTDMELKINQDRAQTIIQRNAGQ